MTPEGFPKPAQELSIPPRGENGFPEKPPSRRIGGQPKSPEDRHTSRKIIAFRDSEADLLGRAADLAGMPVAVFIRNAAVVAARKVLEGA